MARRIVLIDAHDRSKQIDSREIMARPAAPRR